MNSMIAFIGNNISTLVLGMVLIAGVMVFAWYDYRRTSRIPSLGTVMVKNRLKGF